MVNSSQTSLDTHAGHGLRHFLETPWTRPNTFGGLPLERGTRQLTPVDSWEVSENLRGEQNEGLDPRLDSPSQLHRVPL